MKNSVVATVGFDFKGEHHAPSLQIDLDKVMQNEGELDRLHHTIAVANAINASSYDSDMMMAADLHFDKPTGMATSCFHDGEFDIEEFKTKWQEQQVLEKVRPIAERCVGVSDLDGKPKLKAALIEAYLAGKASR
jgi:hypothetical protein